MNLSEFYKLHLDDRMQLVLNYGRYLAIRKEGQLKINTTIKRKMRLRC